MSRRPFGHAIVLGSEAGGGGGTPIDPDDFVEIAGDTMTGPLILSADPVTDLGAATKQYVDAVLVNYNITFNALQYALMQQRGVLTNVDVHALTAPTTQGTATAFQDSTGSYINYATAATTGQQGGWTASASATQLQLLPFTTWVIKTGPDITTVRYWIGMTDSTIITDDIASGLSTIELMGFRFSTVAGDTVWQVASKADGDSGATFSSSGVTVAANTRYVLQVQARSTTLVEYRINGALVGTRTANLPTVDTILGLTCGIQTQSNAARSIRVRRTSILSL